MVDGSWEIKGAKRMIIEKGNSFDWVYPLSLERGKFFRTNRILMELQFWRLHSKV
jgi:hypothetical protein